MSQYKIVYLRISHESEGEFLQKFENEVQSWIQAGWRCNGGAKMVTDTHGTILAIYQTII